MEYWGMENVCFDELVGLTFSKTIRGTSNSSMIFFPEQYGLRAFSFTGDFKLLQKLLSNKIPVIVLQDFKKGFKLGHFRVVIGMELEKKLILVKDPAKKKIQKMKWDKFQALWERGNSINNNRWAMIVIPEFFDFQIEEIYHSPLTALNRGTYYYQRFDYPNACIEYEKAYKKNKTNVDVLKYYAQVLIRLKNHDLALGITQRLIKLDPDDAVAYDLLGLNYFYTGHYDQALIYLKKAVQLNKDSKNNSFIDLHYEQVKKYVEEKETD
jgi:tetratricopeptide (TPR) repeat protein